MHLWSSEKGACLRLSLNDPLVCNERLLWHSQISGFILPQYTHKYTKVCGVVSVHNDSSVVRQ